MYREIVRNFGPHHVRVFTIHPQAGELYRGRIVRCRRRGGWQCRWEVYDFDHYLVAEVVGDSWTPSPYSWTLPRR
jgi:hypothetical protein